MTIQRVLLVEDDLVDARRVIDLLGKLSAQTDAIHVPTLSAALDALSARAFDVILLDLYLPDSAGVDCVASVRATAREIPLVVLTGIDDDDLALTCIRAGAQDYLVKDQLDSDRLRRAIGYSVARYAEMAARQRADDLQERLAAIVSSSDDAIMTMNAEGQIESWNRGAEDIFGLSTDEVVGRSCRDVLRFYRWGRQGAKVPIDPFVEPDHGVRDVVYETSARGARQLSMVVRTLAAAGDGAVRYAAICRDVTDALRRDLELDRQNRELQTRTEMMRALAKRLTDVREDERTRLSREFHDGLGQLLTGLKMDLRWVSRQLPESVAAPATKRLSESESLIDETIKIVQRIATELRPTALDALGLSVAVRGEARRFAERTGIDVSLDLETKEAIPPAVATALFRIFQEMMTNVARHAEATSVQVMLRSTDSLAQLVVLDDGRGFSSTGTDADVPKGGLGLLSMNERALAVGGSFVVESKPGEGTRAEALVPRSAA